MIISAYHFPFRINAHRDIDEFLVQERHASFQTPCRCCFIRSQAIILVQGFDLHMQINTSEIIFVKLNLLGRENSHTLRHVSRWNSSLLGALWKYKYPPKISSEPSPEITIFTPSDLILRDMRNMGVLALIVVTSYVSMW